MRGFGKPVSNSDADVRTDSLSLRHQLVGLFSDFRQRSYSFFVGGRLIAGIRDPVSLSYDAAPVHVYSEEENPSLVPTYIDKLPNSVHSCSDLHSHLIRYHEEGNNLLRGTRCASQMAEK